MNILLLAAGEGKRFTEAGHPPKPLIDLYGLPMWEFVLGHTMNHLPLDYWKEAYVVTKKEYELEKHNPGYRVIINTVGKQRGAAHSALQGIVFGKIPLDEPLLIMNCDQLAEFDGAAFEYLIATEEPDGMLFHFIEKTGENKWGRSIIDCDVNGDCIVKEIVEKIPVSDYSHTGHYYFKRAGDFVDYALKMIENGTKVNGEYFLSPVYNLMIEDGLIVTPFFVDKFIPLGVPEDLQRYLNESN